MKIITENAAYLQKYYFGILLESTCVTQVGIPISICEVPNKKSFSKYASKDFIKFTKREEIDFLKNATWIPDFNDYLSRTNDEVKEEIESLDNEGSELNEWFENLSRQEQNLKFGYASVKAKMLMYKKESLEDILALIEKNMNPVVEKKSLIRKLHSMLHRKGNE
jgi:hypothetical protein